MGREASKQTRREGRRYTPRIPATGPPRLTTCTCMRSPGVAYRHTQEKTGRAALRARHLSMCFSLGVQVVVSSFRVMMIGDDIFFLLIIAHFLCPACALAGWLSWLSPHVYDYTSSRFPKIGRQAGRQAATFGRDRTGDITTHRIINAFFLLRSARALKHWHGVVLSTYHTS